MEQPARIQEGAISAELFSMSINQSKAVFLAHGDREIKQVWLLFAKLVIPVLEPAFMRGIFRNKPLRIEDAIILQCILNVTASDELLV